MQCQECQQRPATFYFQHIINGEKQEVHVCEVCAQENGYTKPTNENYSLQDLLTGLLNFDASQLGSKPIQQKQPEKTVHCPQCNMTFSKFQQLGKFGCASCYETFANQIGPILRRVHSGNTEHFGKIPKRAGGSIQKKKQIEHYRNEMKKLVKEEAFEQAAELRDKIKALENEPDKEKGESKE